MTTADGREPTSTAAPATVDAYTRENVFALVVISTDGHRNLNGVPRATIRAFARRSLVTDLGDGRAIITGAGKEALRTLGELD